MVDDIHAAKVIVIGVFSAGHLLKLRLTPMEVYPDWMHNSNPHKLAVKTPILCCQHMR